MNETTPWLAGPILIPFVTAMVVFLSGQRKAAFVTISASCCMIFVVALLTRQVWLFGAQRHAIGGWLAPLGIELYADGLTTIMLIMSVVVGTSISVYALGYFSYNSRSAEIGNNNIKKHDNFFWILWLFLWAALNALFLSGDIFNIYITLELLTLSAVALVSLEEKSKALTAAMRYLLISLFASGLFLIGVAILYSRFGILELKGIASLISGGNSAGGAFALMTVGLLIKTALFPMHFWLPSAHSKAPTPVSSLLSALVIKGSFYILLRLWFEVFQADITTTVGQFLGWMAAAAIVWGSLQAFNQKRLKLLVAYSTVAQVGYLFLLFPLASSEEYSEMVCNGAVYQAVSHGFAKAAMFMVAGNVIRAVGHDRIKDMEGVFRQLPISAFAFALAGLTIMGMPPSGGFAAKWLLITSALQSGQWWWAVILVVGGLLAAGYVFSVLKYAFTETKISNVQLNHVPCWMQWTTLTLSLLALFIGFTSIPLELLKI